jgi:hypothetical protein
MPAFAPYRTAAEIEEVVRRFEACEYTPEEFVHARHLTVAAYYFSRSDRETAENRMRAGLHKFIGHHGKDGYHETITGFWLHMAAYYSGAEIRGEELVPFVNDVVERLGDKDLIYKYFSKMRLYSAEAKAAWVEPDLKALP